MATAASELSRRLEDIGTPGATTNGHAAPPATRERMDLRNTWQVVVGSVLVPLGVALILMSWYGAAHTHYVQQQIPYLVSGSFAGLGCMVLGGLLYWAHWLYRIYDQADQHHEEELAALHQMVRAVGYRETPAGSRPGEHAAFPAGDTGAPVTPHTGSIYATTETGSVYHRLDCPVIAHRSEGVRVRGEDAVRGLDPCRICMT